MNKFQLRHHLRRRREDHVASLSLVDQCILIANLAERVGARLAEARSVAAYLPVGAEIDSSSIIAAAEARGLTIALPYLVDMRSPMRFLAWRPGETLRPGPYGIKQPLPDAAEVAPDIILTPLVGFDRTLNRLGQGAGFYDRAFANHADALRIGLAWSVQEVESIPTDPWDVRLHAVATEREWIEPTS